MGYKGGSRPIHQLSRKHGVPGPTTGPAWCLVHTLPTPCKHLANALSTPPQRLATPCQPPRAHSGTDFVPNDPISTLILCHLPARRHKNGSLFACNILPGSGHARFALNLSYAPTTKTENPLYDVVASDAHFSCLLAQCIPRTVTTLQVRCCRSDTEICTPMCRYGDSVS